VNTSDPRELGERRKLAVLATCCLSLLIVSMDVTIVNVALPAIRRELGSSGAQLQWVVDAYTLVLAALLLLAGAAADRFGRRKVFQIGLVVFGIGSLLCSMAHSPDQLIAARALQGIGGSMLNPVAMSIITSVFTERQERARAVGVWGAVVGVSMALGPMLGGVLLDAFGWRSVFWVNLPICVAALIGTAILVPESRSGNARGFDPLGQLAGVVFLVAVVFGLIHGPEMGWADRRTLAVFAVGIVALTGFCIQESRARDPFIDLRFFRSVPFASATLVAVCAFSTYGAFLFLNSLYLQGIRHMSAVHTGLAYLAVAVGPLLFSPLSGRLIGRYGPRPSLLVGGVAMTAGVLALSTVGAHTSMAAALPMYAVFGIGFGMVNAPITTAAVSGMPADRTGAASAIASTSRQVGASIGVALCSSVAGSVAAVNQFVHGMHTLWLVLAVFTAIVVVLAVVSTSAWARRTSDRVAPLLQTPKSPAHV
jgi:EmrB/QacA subfamily drug resistance transporter